MIAGLPAAIATLGPTGFAALAWGAILLVVVAFAYVAWALVAGRGDGH